jgi:CRISPR/Cas system CMR-associated protein Cmr1 (group 7 of RAMP superfamily)
MGEWSYSSTILDLVTSRRRVYELQDLVSLLKKNLSTFTGIGLKTQNTAVGIRCADHATPSIHKSWH